MVSNIFKGFTEEMEKTALAPMALLATGMFGLEAMGKVKDTKTKLDSKNTIGQQVDPLNYPEY